MSTENQAPVVADPTQWRSFDGRYRKTFHLARLPDGWQWAAWPNAGNLNCGRGGQFRSGDRVEFRECSYEEYVVAIDGVSPEPPSQNAVAHKSGRK